MSEAAEAIDVLTADMEAVLPFVPWYEGLAEGSLRKTGDSSSCEQKESMIP